MKSNWEVLEEMVYRGDKAAVCGWLRRFKKYPHSPIGDYLDMDSDEPWLHEIIQEAENREMIEKFAALPEEYLVSVEDLKKAIYGF